MSQHNNKQYMQQPNHWILSHDPNGEEYNVYGGNASKTGSFNEPSQPAETLRSERKDGTEGKYSPLDGLVNRGSRQQTASQLEKDIASRESYSVVNFNSFREANDKDVGYKNENPRYADDVRLGETEDEQLIVTDEQLVETDEHQADDPVEADEDDLPQVQLQYNNLTTMKRQLQSDTPLQFQMIDEKEEYPSFEQSSTALLPRATLDDESSKSSMIKEAYSLFVWGSGKDGRCGNQSEEGFQVPTEINIYSEKFAKIQFSKLSCGYHHSAAISAKGRLYTWGRGIFGQLGHNDTENKFIPTLVKSLSVKQPIRQVACGW